MMIKRQSTRGCWKTKVFIFISAVTIVLSGSCLFAAEQATASGVARYRVFSLKHISAEQGKKYLADAGVGTVSQLPGVEALLVTAQAEELIKASAILGLVDAEEPFSIKTISAASETAKFSSNEQIAAKVGDISIGTFSNPPDGDAKTKAIIDVHNDAVIVVAPAEQLEKIISAIEQLHGGLQGSEPNKSAEAKPGGVSHPQADAAQSAKVNKTDEVETKMNTYAELKRAEEELKKVTASSEPAGQADMEVDEPNELFDKLLNSIAKTGEIAAEGQGQQLSQPNAVAPQTAAVPEVNENNPSVDLKKIEESAPQITEEPQEPNLAAEEPQSEPNLMPASPDHNSDNEVGKARPYEPAPIANGNEMLELDLPEKLNIIDLVDLVGKYLQLDYMYDDTQVRGEVSLKLQGPVKVRDLYPLLESVLKFRGFVMTRKGNLVTIVPAADALGIDPLLIPDTEGVQLGDVVITRVFRLRYIDTASAQNLLTNMKLGASISPIPETGTLIITEYAYRMARVEELLDMVDQPGAPRGFRFRQLKYTMAATLAPKIKTLAEQLGTVSVNIAAPSAAQTPRRIRRGQPLPEPTPAAPAATAAGAAKTAVYLDADERTNRILMIGLEEQLSVVDSLIDSLDVEQQDLRTLRLYDIQHVGADEVVKKLGELGIISSSKAATGGGRIIAGTRPSTPGAPGAPATPAPAAPASAATADVEPLVEEPQVVVIESTNSLLVNATPEQHIRIATIISFVDSETLTQAIPYVIYSLENQNPEDLAEVLQKFIQETIKDKEGKVQQTIKKTEEDIIIVPDKNTFSVLVYASKKNQEWIGSLIKQLDKRRPQVLIDVMLVGIRDIDSFNYDLQLVSKLPEMVAGGGMQGPITALLKPFPSNTVEELSSNPSDAGAFTGFYSNRHIQALLTLMQKKDYGRILARPKILVNDNEKGHIDTTTTIYVARTSSTYLPSTVVTTTPTTTPSNTAVTSTTFDQFPSGIKLDITPHISEGSLLRLEVQLSRSNQTIVTGATENTPPGPKTEDNVDTIVTVPDDSTIILGGVITLDQSKTNSKVPFFGDIPLAGGLFRKIDDSSTQTKLYVFVKANILRPDDTIAGLADLKKMSDRNRGAVENFENRFQQHQDWPGVEPKPVEPLHVLESE